MSYSFRKHFDLLMSWVRQGKGDNSKLILTRWLFLRLLGIVYFIAFASLATQVLGLVGSSGILPVVDFHELLSSQLGVERYWLFPTLTWMNSSDIFLMILSLGGAILSLLLILDIFTVPLLVMLWMMYLSLFYSGQVFMRFQWDTLLLETGFLAIFLMMIPLVVWVARFLLFRLMFASGYVKLASGDPSWRDFTAFNFHYETQPLPHSLSWYIHQLPQWFDQFSVAGMYFVELVVPFFFFAPRKLRLIAASLTVILQLFILFSGNYTFFNILTIALCVLLLDDAFIERFSPQKLIKRLKERVRKSFQKKLGSIWSRLAVGIPILAILIALSLQINQMALKRLPKPFDSVWTAVENFRIVNSYGLFAVMTKSRPEIIIQGSADGQTWEDYGFRYKPGDLSRRPALAQPHQPRLDWQMWFAALSNYQRSSWFVNFAKRLLEGSPEVLKLMDHNPFPLEPPRFIRALVYDYHFTSWGSSEAKSGQWWWRDNEGVYLPEISLKAWEG